MSNNPKKSMNLPQAAVEALSQGRKIEAVKILRREWNMDLNEAKETVEAFMARRPSMRTTARLPRVDTGIGRFLLLAVLMILLFAGYYLWVGK